MPPLLNRFALLVLAGAVLAGAAPRALRGYALESSSWAKGTSASPTQIAMTFHLGAGSGAPAYPSTPLQDGSTTWAQVLQAALTDWNQYITTAKFATPVNDSSAPPSAQGASNHNAVFFSGSIYGDSWGGTGTLGITLLIYDSGNHNVDTDVLFNTTAGITWDSFRGPLQVSHTDLRRIALHEFGHALGLDHPDDAGQTVAAIMNSVESNTDDLTADDIAGGRYLYGSGPGITTQPGNQTVAQGSAVTLTVVASGSGPFTYQWQKNGVAISGATNSTLNFPAVQATDNGSYTVIVSNGAGSTTSSTAVLTVTAPVAITRQPMSIAGLASGFTAVFSVAATGSPAPAYQWKLNNVAIHGATDAYYFISAATAASLGAGPYSFTCTATNSSNSVTSTAATLTFGSAANPGYLINISARAAVGTGSNILIGGYGVYGSNPSGTKQLLIRGAGPALNSTAPNPPFNITGALATPQLALFDNSGAVIATNIGWGNAPTPGPAAGSAAPHAASASLFPSVGAFNFANGSADTAMVFTAARGNATMQVSGVGGTTGVALVEIYDADLTYPPASRLINISARASVGTGANVLIGGFALYGGPETLLIRGVGPALSDAPYNLTGTLAQPVLTIFDNSGAAIATNTGWGGDSILAGVMQSVGGSALDSGNQDSMLLVTLPSGNYTVQVSGLNNGTGVALVDFYEVE